MGFPSTKQRQIQPNFLLFSRSSKHASIILRMGAIASRQELIKPTWKDSESPWFRPLPQWFSPLSLSLSRLSFSWENFVGWCLALGTFSGMVRHATYDCLRPLKSDHLANNVSLSNDVVNCLSEWNLIELQRPGRVCRDVLYINLCVLAFFWCIVRLSEDLVGAFQDAKYIGTLIPSGMQMSKWKIKMRILCLSKFQSPALHALKLSFGWLILCFCTVISFLDIIEELIYLTNPDLFFFLQRDELSLSLPDYNRACTRILPTKKWFAIRTGGERTSPSEKENIQAKAFSCIALGHKYHIHIP